MPDRMQTESALSGAGADAKSDVAATIDERLNKHEIDLLRRICDLCGACGKMATAATETASSSSVDGKAAGARSSVCLCDRRRLALPSPLTNLRDCYDRLLDLLLGPPPSQQQSAGASATPSAGQLRRRRRSGVAPTNRFAYVEKRKEFSTVAQSSQQSTVKKATVSDATLVPRLRAVSAAVRDKSFRMRLTDNGRLREACGRLAEVTYTMTEVTRLQDDYSDVCRVTAAQALRLVTDIFRHLSEDKTTQEVLVEQRVHAALAPLLSSGDLTTQTNALRALESLAWNAECARSLSALNCVERLLAILDGQDGFLRRLAANMLQALCIEQQAAETLRMCGGIPILLSRLCCKDLPTLIAIAYCLRNLAHYDRLGWAIRDTGAIPILLSHLRTQAPTPRLKGTKSLFDHYVDYQLSDDSSPDTSPPTPAKHNSISSGSEGFFEDCTSAEDQDALTFESTAERIRRLRLKVACCAALAELVKDNRSAQIVVLSNGIHLLAKSCLPMEREQEGATSASPDQGCSIPETEMADALAYTSRTLQLSAVRTLRQLYADERYRSTLQKMLPTCVLSAFVDVTHYNRSLNAYDVVVNEINSLSPEQLAAFQRRVRGQHQHPHEAIRVVRNFEILEVLGSGAFGCVYKVRRLLSDNNDGAAEGNQQQDDRRRRLGSSFTAEAPLYALKEVTFVARRHDNHGMSELAILKERLAHPNVVEYYDTFIEGGKLYILMELLDGVPLAMELKSRKQQGKHLSEKKIWHYFMQIIMALRYLHKEKRIVHRDLTPNNIMLTHGNKVTITDFGLARKRKTTEEVMHSAVGTLLYSCPEIVSCNAYDDKADIWSAGCILYQMCALEPPFDGENCLALAKRIAGGQYKPMPAASQYSSQIHLTISRCLTVDPLLRPDVIGLAATLTNQLMCHVDRTSRIEAMLRRRVDKGSTMVLPIFPPDDALPLGLGEPGRGNDNTDNEEELRCNDDSTDDDDGELRRRNDGADDDGERRCSDDISDDDGELRRRRNDTDDDGERRCSEDDADDGRANVEENAEEAEDEALPARRLNEAAGASPPVLPPPILEAFDKRARLREIVRPSLSHRANFSASAFARESSKTGANRCHRTLCQRSILTTNGVDRQASIESKRVRPDNSPSAAAAASLPRRDEAHLKATAGRDDVSSDNRSSSSHSTGSSLLLSSSSSSLGTRSGASTSEGDDDVFYAESDNAQSQAVVSPKGSNAVDKVAASTEAQAASTKAQAASTKVQSASTKVQSASTKALSASTKALSASTKAQAASTKAQAASTKAQAALTKAQAHPRARPAEGAAAVKAVSVSPNAASLTTALPRSNFASKPAMHGAKVSASRRVSEVSRSSATQRPGAANSADFSSTSAASAGRNAVATAELVPHSEPGKPANLLRVRIPQRLLHSIDVDPTQALLQVMSKLEYVTQLPPTRSFCPRRHLVGAFKRWLVSPGCRSPQRFKEELRKYVSQSQELVDMQVDPTLVSAVLHHFDKGKGRQSVGADRFEKERRGEIPRPGCSLAVLRGSHVEDATAFAPGGVTYQLLHMVVESILQESKYYREAKNPPLVDVVDRV